MSILLTILKIIGYVILAVLAVLLVLLCFPASAKVLFRKGKLSVDLKYLFVKYHIGIPEEEKAPEEKKEEPADEEDLLAEDEHHIAFEEPRFAQEKPADHQTEEPLWEKTEETVPEPPAVTEDEDHGEEGEEPEDDEEQEDGEEGGIAALWKKIRPFVTPATRTLVALFHHIHMDDVEIVWNVRSDDAARVGMLSGLAWMVIGDVMKTLALLFGKNLTYREITVMPCFDPKAGADERIGCEVSARPIIIVLIALYFGVLYLKERLFNREK